jgi:DNA-binding NarL/FixJ family response regulator
MTVEIPTEIRAAVEAVEADTPARGHRPRKLTDRQIREIQVLVAEGTTFKTLAQVYDVTPATVAAYSKLDLE